MTALTRILVGFAILLPACDPAPPELTPVTPPAALTTKVQLKGPDDALLCKLKAKDDGFRIYDGADASLGEAEVQQDRVKLKGQDDQVLWKLKRKDYGLEIEDAAGTRLFKLQWRDDEWRLEDANEAVLARAKPKADGLELRDPQGRTLAKAKRRDGKVALESESGDRLFDVTGTDDASAAVWFGLDTHFSLEQRAAMFVFFHSFPR